MLTDLGHQLDIWTQLKLQLLGTPMWHFLSQIIWIRKTDPKSQLHLLVAGCLPCACLPFLLLASLSTLLLQPALNSTSSERQGLETSSSPEVSQDLSHRTGRGRQRQQPHRLDKWEDIQPASILDRTSSDFSVFLL